MAVLEVPITTMTGKETFPDGSASVYVFTVPDGVALGKAADKSGGGVKRIKRGANLSAAKGMYKDHHGAWREDTYLVHEGTILMVYLGNTRSFGKRRRQNWVYLMVRGEAALVRFSIPLTQCDRSSFSHAHIEGKFDILTLEEAQAYGAKIDNIDMVEFENESTIYELRELQAALTPKPEFQVREIHIGDETHTLRTRKKSAKRKLNLE